VFTVSATLKSNVFAIAISTTTTLYKSLPVNLSKCWDIGLPRNLTDNNTGDDATTKRNVFCAT